MAQGVLGYVEFQRPESEYYYYLGQVGQPFYVGRLVEVKLRESKTILIVAVYGIIDDSIGENLSDIQGIIPEEKDLIQYRNGAFARRTPEQVKGDLLLVKADLALENVDNTSDANKPISNATATALSGKADLVGGRLAIGQLPDIAISWFLGDVSDESQMLLLLGEAGDWCYRTDKGVSWMLTADTDPEVEVQNIGLWRQMGAPGSVTSVFGRIGPVAAQSGDYTPEQVGADPAGAAATALSVHTGATDPHPQYYKRAAAAKTANYNLQTDDSIIVCQTAGIIITLFDLTSANVREYTIMNLSSGPITIAAHSGQYIGNSPSGNAASLTLYPQEWADLIPVSGAWRII